jgi:hypothetical protein
MAPEPAAPEPPKRAHVSRVRLKNSRPRSKGRSARARPDPDSDTDSEKTDDEPDSVTLGERESVLYQLEIIEARIQRGEDLEHCHPAMAVSLVSDFSLDDITPQEKEAKRNYETIIEDQTIPNSWPPRFWDSPHDRMSDAQSRELLEKLREFQSDAFLLSGPKQKVRRIKKPSPHGASDSSNSEQTADEEFIESSPSEAAGPPRTRIRTRSAGRIRDAVEYRRLCVRLSSKCFATDNSDDETDFSEF